MSHELKKLSNKKYSITQTHLSPRVAIASLRSILALKPPFTHSSAAPLPENSPRRKNDLPTIAAVIAPIPIMMGADMTESLKSAGRSHDLSNFTD